MSESNSPGFWQSSRRAYLTRALVVYAGVSYAVLELVSIFVDQLGLPGWFFPGTLVLLVLGLPIVIATAWVQARGRASEPEAGAGGEPEPAALLEAEPAEPSPPRVRRHWLTWRKALAGGAAILVLWGLVVAAYMTMRALGIGPVGSLVAAGVLDERERLIVADFQNNTDDPLLGQAATEAFRIDFSQSPIVTVMEPASVGQVLTRMQRDPSSALEPELAREVAIRAGVKAVVAGDITPVGRGFVLAAQLVSAQDGRVLAAYRETAPDTTAIIGAIDQLSNKLRERIGESLKTIRGNEPLDQVTTGSLEALRKYSMAVRAIELGDNERGLALLEEATALDTAFAMAWRKLGITLGNVGRDRVRQIDALTRAYELREERLTDRERYLTLGSYHSAVTGDDEAAIAAYRSLLDLYPNDTWALNNLALLYEDARDFRRADELYRRAIGVDSVSGGGALYYGNAIGSQVALGDFEGAERLLQRFLEVHPEHPLALQAAARLAGAQFDYAAAELRTREFRESQRTSPLWQVLATFMLAQVAEVRGQLDEAERLMRELMRATERQGQTGLYIGSAVRIAFYDLMLRGRPERAVETLEATLEQHPLASIDSLERPYPLLAIFYGLAGRPERATALLEEYDRVVDPRFSQAGVGDVAAARGVLALADGRYEAALSAFREADRGRCTICVLPMLGLAYDAAGEADSVVAVYERYLSTPYSERLGASDWWALAGIYERLAGLYELRGDREKALDYYRRFVELWSDADRELQPRVRAAQRALERLAAEV